MRTHRRSRRTASISRSRTTSSLRGGGTLRVGADATYIASYDIEDPQAGLVDGVGRRNFANFGTSTPEWRRQRASCSGRRDRHAVNAFVRYIDSYVDDEVDLGQGAAFYRAIDSQITVDAQYTLTLTRGARADVDVRRHQPVRRGPAARRDERRLRLEGPRPARPHVVRESPVPLLEPSRGSRCRR